MPSFGVILYPFVDLNKIALVKVLHLEELIDFLCNKVSQILVKVSIKRQAILVLKLSYYQILKLQSFFELSLDDRFNLIDIGTFSELFHVLWRSRATSRHAFHVKDATEHTAGFRFWFMGIDCS